MLAPALGFMLAVALLAVAPSASAGESAPAHLDSAWPVRLNLGLPIGSTYGSDELHGFTWGVRTNLMAYPAASGRGVGVGGYGEMLIADVDHASWTLGATASMPVVQWSWGDIRVAGHAGYMTNDVRRGISFGLGAAMQVPIYFYDLQLGVRATNTVTEDGRFGTSILCDLDLGLLLAAKGFK